MIANAPTEGRGLHAVLPWRGGLGLFRVTPPEVLLVATLPAEDEAKGRLSEDGHHLLVLDRGGTRLHCSRLRPTGQLEEAIELPSLEPGTRVDDVAMIGPVLFAGGLGPVGAAVRRYDLRLGGDRWGSLPMPRLDTWRDKSVDFLLVHGTDLIGIDDFVMPLYGLVWDLRDPTFPEHVATVTLTTHTTYEQVRLAAISDRYIALLSEGVNHGRRSTHLSIYSAQDLRERTAYSSWQGADDPSHQSGTTQLLERVSSLAFAGDVLWAACSEGSLLCLDLRGPMLERDPGRRRSSVGRLPQRAPSIELRPVPGLRQIFHLAPASADGVVATGLDPRGQERVAWIPTEQR